jgi:chorismate mutase
MDNRINEIRRKISALRLEMADVEASVRDRINGDRDCTEQALAQLDLRRKITLLIGECKAAGGSDVLPDVHDRVRLRLVKTIGKPERAATRR